MGRFNTTLDGTIDVEAIHFARSDHDEQYADVIRTRGQIISKRGDVEI
jgi:hypothetical protein